MLLDKLISLLEFKENVLVVFYLKFLFWIGIIVINIFILWFFIVFLLVIVLLYKFGGVGILYLYIKLFILWL